jgi:hypothetical protein
MVQHQQATRSIEMMQGQAPTSYGAIAEVPTIIDEQEVTSPEGSFRHQHATNSNRTKGFAAMFSMMMAAFLVHSSGMSRSSGDTFLGSVPLMLSSGLSSSASRDGDTPRFFKEQPVDHFDTAFDETWDHRYYKSTEFFGGPGHPIFVIVGGEGALDHGMLYPYVTKVLAKRFQAAVLQIEHRFYGPYHPVANATTEELLKLLTPHQAMADMVHLTRHIRDSEFKCVTDKSSDSYCPIVTVGASYPGFLSALFRLMYPDFVDISYASSAPLLMYAQAVDPNIYYDIVTSAAERSSPGCAVAVRSTLDDAVYEADTASSLQEAAERLGICPDSVPSYITTKEKCFVMLSS